MTDLTRRQEIQRWLDGQELSFDELRELVRVPVKLLEEDLRHLERSLRKSPAKLRVEPARCPACGFVLQLRPGRFATPSRCPRCRRERLDPPRLRIG